MTKVLAVDGMNFLHRARSGFVAGDHAVTFNFFRNLRALVEMHSPTRILFVLEGRPVSRLDVLPTYKANRKIVGHPDDPATIQKHEEQRKFFAQVDESVALLSTAFPVSVVRHPHHECDDVIYNLIAAGSSAVPWVVASNDSDFIQLLQEFDHVSLYNPMTKKFVEPPPYDYVTWKALRGDSSDNIPGLPKVSDATATRLVTNPEELTTFLSNPENSDKFLFNYNLIKFTRWSDKETDEMTSSSPTRNWDGVKSQFENWGFASITNDKSWAKYVNTFDHMWGRPGDEK